MAPPKIFQGPVISIGANGGVIHDIVQEYNLADAALQSDADTGAGVVGTSSGGIGVFGKSGTYIGIRGEGGSNHEGVVGLSTNAAGVRGSGLIGVRGESNTGYAVWGTSTKGTGLRGSTNGASPSAPAVAGENPNDSGTAVFGSAPGQQSTGVVGFGGYRGVWGQSTNGFGVDGISTGGGYGVRGVSSTGTGVYGYSSSGKAGVFVGDVQVTGTLFKGNVMFKIDHPLDPENKYLNHSGVESEDMKNLYDGIAELDEKGQAVVELPKWFEALNKDFRYQLTPIGDSAPDLHIGKEIARNSFVIRGGRPGMRVCWQVTGIRRDAFANAHRVPVEESKPDTERGLFLHPELFKKSEKKRIPFGSGPDALAKAEKEFNKALADKPKLPDLPDVPEVKPQRTQKKRKR